MSQNKVFISILFLFSFKVFSQSSDQNFVLSHSYKQKGGAINLQNVKTSIQYLDGLGRPMQAITIGIAPNGNDAISPIVYDTFGREKLAHLPYTSATSSNFQAGAISSQEAYYQNNTLGLQGGDNSKAYTETFLEASPLNRTLGTQAEGANSLSSTISYGTNSANEVKLYIAPFTTNGDYGPNQLYKTTQTDENSKIIETFTDNEGKLICKKVKTGNESLDTYYVYDSFDRLTTVLQPEYQTNQNADYFAFQYNFDDRGRTIGKKNPGADWEYMIYDSYDRLRFTQDGNQRNRNVWYFMKYDALDRLVYEGEISSVQSASDLNIALTNNNAHHEERLTSGLGYTLASTYPSVTANDIYTETFYDNYTGLTDAYLNVYSITKNDAVIGQITGSRTKILGTTTKLISVNYYDSEYRPIQTIRELYNLGGRKERKSIKYLYDLAAVIAEEKVEHFLAGSISNIHTKKINYDHADRPLSIQETVSIDVNSQSISKTAFTQAYRYNQLGQQTQKWTHSDNGIDYRHRTDKYYNIRGWHTEGNSLYKQDGSERRYFGYLLDYTVSSKYTNGNISAMYLAEKDEGGYNKGQTFAYDGANRLTGSTGVAGFNANESGITYDKNGNIKTLTRAGDLSGTFAYEYNGNRINKVNNLNYGFDANGNTTTDGNRALTIDYNYLNLTNTIAGSGLNQSYVYDSNGQKHQFTSGSLVTKYAGPFEYDANNKVTRVSITDGQAKVSFGVTIRFEYYHKDHLKNTRVVFEEFGSQLQRTDYYPFGQETTVGGNKYNFLGRETQAGTGYVDLMARFYDPKVPHFLTQDPVIEGQEDQSLYQYGWNNPILRSDPNGDCPVCPLVLPYLPAIGTAIAEAAIATGATAVLYELVKNAKPFPGSGYSPAVGTAMSSSKPGELTSLKANSSNSGNSNSSNTSSSGKNGGTFGDGKDSKNNGSSNSSLKSAKESNGIPKSQQPDKTIKPNTPEGDKAKLDSRNVKQYEYTNSKGEKISIREDKPAKYNDGDKGDQGKHFNAGKSNQKLEQHHNN